MYVANVSIGCFKSRSDVASPSSRLLLPRSVSPLLDAGDVRAAWARVGASGVGGVSRLSGAESEQEGRAAQAREATSGHGPRVGRSDASLTVSYLGVKNHIYHLSPNE
jgi:hypothetical protein